MLLLSSVLKESITFSYMKDLEKLQGILIDSLKMQLGLFKLIAYIVLLGIAIIGIMLITQEAKSEEDQRIKFILTVSCLGGILFSFLVFYIGRKRVNTIKSLLNEHPEKIVWAYKYRVQRRGIVFHGVHFYTIEKKRFGFQVKNELEGDFVIDKLPLINSNILIGDTSENKEAYKNRIQ